ncbi:hypothetical protein EYF80_010594 [Liparis tanakae]|uniref:Uncharacterized protein n=1 Tax=Liparis tanakae TaxID=230148 RepID=A0A4Z2IMM5_9TELE|nr:hypothetical protein EYF80_010594 [Liparis tanakae]
MENAPKKPKKTMSDEAEKRKREADGARDRTRTVFRLIPGRKFREAAGCRHYAPEPDASLQACRVTEVTGRLDGGTACWDGSPALGIRRLGSPLAIGIQTYCSVCIENGAVEGDNAELVHDANELRQSSLRSAKETFSRRPEERERVVTRENVSLCVSVHNHLRLKARFHSRNLPACSLLMGLEQGHSTDLRGFTVAEGHMEAIHYI